MTYHQENKQSLVHNTYNTIYVILYIYIQIYIYIYIYIYITYIISIYITSKTDTSKQLLDYCLHINQA